MTTEYTLFFELKKYKHEHKFNMIVKADDENIQEVIEEKTNMFTELYHTPVRCYKYKKREDK